MRTTLALADDVYRAAQGLAKARHEGLGKVVSELARKGLRAAESAQSESGLPVFAVAESAPLFGPDEVAAAEDEA